MDRYEEQPWGEKGLDPRMAVERLFSQTVALIPSERDEWVWLRGILREIPGVRVIAEETDVEQALHAVGTLRPDVILVAAEVVVGPRVDSVRQLHECSPVSKIVVLGEEQHHGCLIGLGKWGVCGYFGWEGLDAWKVQAGLLAAAAGLKFATAGFAEEFIAAPERRQSVREGHVVLTERERAVVRLMRAGMRAQEVADELAVGLRTIQRIIARLQEKLGVSTPYELGSEVTQRGLDQEGV